MFVVDLPGDGHQPEEDWSVWNFGESTDETDSGLIGHAPLVGHAPTHRPRLQEILQMCQSAVSPVHSGLLDGVFQGICSLMNFQF